jgi:hypothetical protein
MDQSFALPQSLSGVQVQQNLPYPLIGHEPRNYGVNSLAAHSGSDLGQKSDKPARGVLMFPLFPLCKFQDNSSKKA